jgi:hypothetical protein
MPKATTLLRGVTEDHGLDNWHPATQASGEAGALPQEGSARSGSKWRSGDRVLPFRGREVQTTGDGFLATFDVPARGVPDRPADLEDKIFRR